MLGDKVFTGLVLEGDSIRVAQVAVEGKKLRLLKLDKFSLAEKINIPQKAESVMEGDDAFGDELDMDADSIFGLEDNEPSLDEAMESGEEDELGLDDLGVDAGGDDLMSLDMADETEGTGQSNEILFYNILTGIDANKVRVGFNIPAGNAIFQLIRDTNFKEVKTKDLIADVEEKLESIYGTSKSNDNYAYEIMEDGSLLLVSVDDESPLLHLLNQSQDLYGGKVIVEEIYPDEVVLTGLVRANYVFPEYEITGVIQFGPKSCRIVFLRGNEILLVSPIINEGVKNKTFLNTVFSKILFQLDTGEVPNLDRIIIANNTLGEEAIHFFKKNFSDIPVSEFTYDEDKFDFSDHSAETVSPFTTAIGMAWAASGMDKKTFPNLSLLPSYVLDRQKIFKLQWHGVLMLLLIFVTPITFNYFYQLNNTTIDRLSSELDRTTAQITQIQPIVESTNQLMSDLSLLKEKLVLLDTLSKGSREWSTKLNILNEGLRNIGSSWVTSMRQADGGTFLEGYTLYRNRIPRLVNIFKEATLLNVSIQEEREQEIYRFSIMVKEFAENRSAYSPVIPEEVQEISIN